MKDWQTLSSFLPACAVIPHATPYRQVLDPACAVMFVDIQGFSMLTAQLAERFGEAEGSLQLAKHVNSFLSQLVRILGSTGGKIVRFAGDAVIAVWTSGDSPAGAAAKAAIELQNHLHNAQLSPEVTMAIRIGVSVGEMALLHVGVSCREILLVGEAVDQAFTAEHDAVAGGDTVLSAAAWSLAKESNELQVISTLPTGAVQLTLNGRGSDRDHNSAQAKPPPATRNGPTTGITLLSKSMVPVCSSEPAEIASALTPYLPTSLRHAVHLAGYEAVDARAYESNSAIGIEQGLFWGNSVQQVLVVMSNTGLRSVDAHAATRYDDALLKIHEVVELAHTCATAYGGEVNKVLFDDKGSTMLTVFRGQHDSELAKRGVLFSLALSARLWEHAGLLASSGVMLGTAFCGTVGSTSRREFTVLGDCVNMAARLMQRAASTGGGICCGYTARAAAEFSGVLFSGRQDLHVKGKDHPMPSWRPVSAELLSLLPIREHPGTGESVFKRALLDQESSIENGPAVITKGRIYRQEAATPAAAWPTSSYASSASSATRPHLSTATAHQQQIESAAATAALTAAHSLAAAVVVASPHHRIMRRQPRPRRPSLRNTPGTGENSSPVDPVKLPVASSYFTQAQPSRINPFPLPAVSLLSRRAPLAEHNAALRGVVPITEIRVYLVTSVVHEVSSALHNASSEMPTPSPSSQLLGSFRVWPAESYTLHNKPSGTTRDRDAIVPPMTVSNCLDPGSVTLQQLCRERGLLPPHATSSACNNKEEAHMRLAGNRSVRLDLDLSITALWIIASAALPAPTSTLEVELVYTAHSTSSTTRSSSSSSGGGGALDDEVAVSSGLAKVRQYSHEEAFGVCLCAAATLQASSKGSTIHVVGPAGSGKSEVVDCFQRGSCGSCSILSVSAHKVATSVRYCGLTAPAHLAPPAQLNHSSIWARVLVSLGYCATEAEQLFQQSIDSSADSVPSSHSAIAAVCVVSALREFVGSHAPLILTIDDAHCLTQTDRVVCADIARAAPSLPVLLIVCERMELTRSETHRRGWLPVDECVALARITQSAAAAVYAAAVGWRGALSPRLTTHLEEACHGNPLAVIALAHCDRAHSFRAGDTLTILSAAVPDMHESRFGAVGRIATGGWSAMQMYKHGCTAVFDIPPSAVDGCASPAGSGFPGPELCSSLWGERCHGDLPLERMVALCVAAAALVQPSVRTVAALAHPHRHLPSARVPCLAIADLKKLVCELQVPESSWPAVLSTVETLCERHVLIRDASADSVSFESPFTALAVKNSATTAQLRAIQDAVRVGAWLQSTIASIADNACARESHERVCSDTGASNAAGSSTNSSSSSETGVAEIHQVSGTRELAAAATTARMPMVESAFRNWYAALVSFRSERLLHWGNRMFITPPPSIPTAAPLSVFNPVSMQKWRERQGYFVMRILLGGTANSGVVVARAAMAHRRRESQSAVRCVLPQAATASTTQI